MNLKEVHDALAVNGRVAKAYRSLAVMGRALERKMSGADALKETAAVDSQVANITNDGVRGAQKVKALQGKVLSASDKLERTGGTEKTDDGKVTFTLSVWSVGANGTMQPDKDSPSFSLSKADGRKVLALFGGVPNGGYMDGVGVEVLAERLFGAMDDFDIRSESAVYGIRKDWTDKDGAPKTMGKLLSVTVREDGACRVQVSNMFGRSGAVGGEDVWSKPTEATVNETELQPA